MLYKINEEVFSTLSIHILAFLLGISKNYVEQVTNLLHYIVSENHLTLDCCKICVGNKCRGRGNSKTSNVARPRAGSV